MTTALINATPHAVAIYSEDDVDRGNPRRLLVRPGAVPMIVIPPSGIVLNASRAEGVTVRSWFSLGGDEVGIPVRNDTFPSVDAPPDPGAAYIVSFLYASAARAAGVPSMLYTVTGAVYASADDKAPCGCVALSAA